MKPYSLLSVGCSHGVATIVGDGKNTICVIGASMSTIARSGTEEYLDQISLKLGEENCGVIAVSVASAGSQRKSCFLINVHRDDEKIIVNLGGGNYFIPLPGRMAQIYPDGRIEVAINKGFVYVNKYPEQPDETIDFQLVDADNLCRYIAGLIDQEQLEKASTGHIEAIAQTKLIQDLKQQLEIVEKKLLAANTEINTQSGKVASYYARNNQLEKELEAAKSEFNKIDGAIRELGRDVLHTDRDWFDRWFTPPGTFRTMLKKFFAKVNKQQKS